MNWYVVQAYSGYEMKVRDALIERINLAGLKEKFGEILVPTEQVVELKSGEKKKTERKFFPGYILLKMEMTDETWHFIKAQPKVTGFLGAKGKPVAISETEANRLIDQISEGIDRPRSSVIYEIGEEVRVSDGPFQSFNGCFYTWCSF